MDIQEKLRRIQDACEGVRLLENAVNTYDNSMKKEVVYILGGVCSVLLNRMAIAVLEAVANRMKGDTRIYRQVREAAKLVKDLHW